MEAFSGHFNQVTGDILFIYHSVRVTHPISFPSLAVVPSLPIHLTSFCHFFFFHRQTVSYSLFSVVYPLLPCYYQTGVAVVKVYFSLFFSLALGLSEFLCLQIRSKRTVAVVFPKHMTGHPVAYTTQQQISTQTCQDHRTAPFTHARLAVYSDEKLKAG